jgi:hemin uptake protein HemP
MQTKSTQVPVAEDAAPPPVHKTVSSSDLFGACREVRIVHHGEQYTLRLTRLGKLILTK